jgi:hypothetical protein
MKQSSLSYKQKSICILDSDPKRLESLKNILNFKFKALPLVSIKLIKSIDEVSSDSCDLIVLYSLNVDETHFMQWLSGFENRWVVQNSIWIPALIVSRVEPSKIPEMLERAALANWYFDILHPDHLSSLPLRVANLLRIHDHLHELLRYERELKLLQKQVNSIEQQLGMTQKEKLP